MSEVQEKTQTQLRRVRELLKRKGYEVDEPGLTWVWARIDEYNYVIEYSENDPDFYSVSFPLELEQKEEKKDKYLAAANHANLRVKLAKVSVDEQDDLLIAVDVIAADARQFVAQFDRYLAAIQTALDLFEEQAGG